MSHQRASAIQAGAYESAASAIAPKMGVPITIQRHSAIDATEMTTPARARTPAVFGAPPHPASWSNGDTVLVEGDGRSGEPTGRKDPRNGRLGSRVDGGRRRWGLTGDKAFGKVSWFHWP